MVPIRSLAVNSQYALITLCGLLMVSPLHSSEPLKKTKESSGLRPLSENSSDEDVELRRSFMRAKLKASSDILEGLSNEDFLLIGSGAEKLYKMSTVEKWLYSDDEEYRQYTNEFQRDALGLVETAKEGKLDKSTLKWMELTMKCIECHRHIREN
ncbi:cytochrome c [Rubinisphaera italica]|uniref:Cytochrome C n=1 Tax=Rubinisphaera italica TaxID=2527969 RepID=A0A5C5X9K2_9PLAN|nr:cytochrome c [Rubinisphaera italica]TWT59666.1 hypothetical protein Pan54_03750 [Rubinisphaera italica]HBN77831.1 hypothetical protein [Planctomycetaceae bacterium]|tara:strand:+ start:442 stop:906 length:465 start_codon:yes stop_codon:yes gene_type:complete